MARTARQNLEGNYFHIMVQGIAKECIFSEDKAKGYYLSCLQKTKSKKDVCILAFCVLDNHAHLLLSAENISVIAEYMRIVNSEYARYYNETNNRVGYVFRDRFRSEVIQNEQYLLNCFAYIHNNPVKAGIIADASEYGYSSYSNYLSRSGIVDFQEAEKFFDINPSNIQALMVDKEKVDWLEYDDKILENKNKVYDELIVKYGLTNVRLSEDDELLIKTAKEVMDRCGISIRKIASLLEVSRERLRKLMSVPPSP